MGKIKNWEKIRNGITEVVWRNKRWSKTEDKWATIEEVSVSKSGFGGWTFLYFINDGKKNNIQKNNIARNKTEAVKYAIKYMRSHPNG
jgi:hypothetical protein